MYMYEIWEVQYLCDKSFMEYCSMKYWSIPAFVPPLEQNAMKFRAKILKGTQFYRKLFDQDFHIKSIIRDISFKNNTWDLFS